MARIDSVRPQFEQDIRSKLESPEIQEALRKGNIHEIMGSLADYKITPEEALAFFKRQEYVLRTKTIQEEALYSGSFEPAPFDPEKHIPKYSVTESVDDADLEVIAKVLTGKFSVAGAKASAGAKSTSSKMSGDKAMSPEKLLELTEDQIADMEVLAKQWDQQLFDAHIDMEVAKQQAKLDDIPNQIKKQLAAGNLEAVLYLIFIKTPVTEAGIFSGKWSKDRMRQMKLNDELAKAAQDLSAKDPQAYSAQIFAMQQQARSGQVKETELSTGLQRMLTHVENAWQTGKGISDVAHNASMQFLRKLEGR